MNKLPPPSLPSHLLPLPSSELPLQIILEGKWSNFATLGISLIYLTTFVPFQCRMKLQKKYSSQEMDEEMNEQKILALARTAQDAIIFQRRRRRDMFIFIFLFRNALRSRIVCLNAGCKDLLVWKV